MEKRHYLEVSNADISSINSINRVVSVGGQVTGYLINNNNYNLQLDEQYELLVTLPANQPYSGVIAHSDTTETWTKDGLYLHNSGLEGSVGFKKVYIKDFLESIPESYQSKMINDLLNDPSVLDGMASSLINNTIYPKEFSIIYINDNQWGIQDQIVAYVSNIYYINSMNDYVPYQNTSNLYNSAWAVPDTIYDPDAKTAGLLSNGIRKDMVIKSKKLIYVVRYEGMLITDTTNYFGDTGLVYLNTTEIGGLAYQMYLNPKFLYDVNGEMIDPLVQSACQTIYIEDAFKHENLKGKILKVW